MILGFGVIGWENRQVSGSFGRVSKVSKIYHRRAELYETTFLTETPSTVSLFFSELKCILRLIDKH
jgi:hypothetical protein